MHNFLLPGGEPSRGARRVAFPSPVDYRGHGMGVASRVSPFVVSSTTPSPSTASARRLHGVDAASSRTTPAAASSPTGGSRLLVKLAGPRLASPQSARLPPGCA